MASRVTETPSNPAHTAEQLRDQLLAQTRHMQAVWSLDGREVDFAIGFDGGVEVGGFLTVTSPTGRRLVVQVHDLSVTERTGANLDVAASQLGMDDSVVKSATVDLVLRRVRGTGAVLGELVDGRLVRAGHEGFDSATLVASTDAEVAAVVEATLGRSVGLHVGRLGRAAVDAVFAASGFSRHTFLCGQSGSGKTYSLGVLLERILLDTTLPMVIIDPNSDYVGLGGFRSREQINASRSAPLSRAAYAELKRRYESQAGVAVASRRSGDLPLAIRLSDLTLEEQALTFGLDPIVDAAEYAAYVDATRSVGAEHYGVADVEGALLRRYDDASRGLAQRIGNLAVGSWSVWVRGDEPSLVDAAGTHRTLVLDTGSLPDPRERSVVALALFGRLRRRPDRAPVSVVIDEAHNVCSPEAVSPLERAVTEHTVWVAGEGRKFGIYMVLSTQRPQKVHRNVLSQCDNLLLMRVNSVADLDELALVFSHVPTGMIAQSRSFQLGEVLAAGPISPTPMRLRMGERWTPEGGADLPTTWASR